MPIHIDIMADSTALFRVITLTTTTTIRVIAIDTIRQIGTDTTIIVDGKKRCLIGAMNLNPPLSENATKAVIIISEERVPKRMDSVPEDTNIEGPADPGVHRAFHDP